MTEQQLRERAEALADGLLPSIYFGNHKSLQRSFAIKFALDFHKQELSGKEIYEAVSVEEKPEAASEVIFLDKYDNPRKAVFDIDNSPINEIWESKYNRWLKKLTLSGEESK